MRFMIGAGSNLSSFYHLEGSIDGALHCEGTACFVAANSLGRKVKNRARLFCLGKCYAAPATTKTHALPTATVCAKESVILKYSAGAPYAALEKALQLEPREIITEVEKSQLRGRGGAGFLTGTKMRLVSIEPGDGRFVVVNADEGDAGAYIDRFIMEQSPHLLLEGMAIAARAVGASRCYIYLRKEYPKAHESLKAAITEAGRNRFPDIEIVIGKGSYVCGEETALLNSIEGKRPEVRTRPPYPTRSGLFGKPTLVNNVETLANLPYIILKGGEAYRQLGFSSSRGTKVVSLNSLFNRPGLYEVEFGIPVRKIVEDIGGGLKRRTLKGVIVGGPLAGIIPPHLLDTPFGFEELRAIGATVGHGGVIAFDEKTSIAGLVHHIFEFGAFESCGKCTPCRLGGRFIEQMFARKKRTRADRKEFESVVRALLSTSLCGLGTGLGEFAASVLRHYLPELEKCFK